MFANIKYLLSWLFFQSGDMCSALWETGSVCHLIPICLCLLSLCFLAGGTLLTNHRNYRWKSVIAQLPVCDVPETQGKGAGFCLLGAALPSLQFRTYLRYHFNTAGVWNVRSRETVGPLVRLPSSPAASLNFWSHRLSCNKCAHCETTEKLLPCSPVRLFLRSCFASDPGNQAVTDFPQWGTVAAAGCCLSYRRNKKSLAVSQ